MKKYLEQRKRLKNIQPIKLLPPPRSSIKKHVPSLRIDRVNIQNLRKSMKAFTKRVVIKRTSRISRKK